jgi:hypothetical protein
MDIDKLRKLKTVIAEYDSNSENEYEYQEYLNMAIGYIRSKNGVFINATNIDWQGRNGVLLADDMKDAAKKMLMNSGNCHTILWKGAERNTIQGVSYHHDCPTGTWFNVMSRAKAIKKGLITKNE